MADPHIDQYETLAYGPFAAKQIRSRVVGLVPECDAALRYAIRQLTRTTRAMQDALGEASGIERVTYQRPAGADDPVQDARGVFTRLVQYVASRKDSRTLVRAVLNGESLTTIKRRRPAKLLAAMNHALLQIDAHQAALPEHAHWATELGAARDALAQLDTQVRTTRAQRMDMTPAVRQAFAEWTRAYGASKSVVEGVLKFAGRADRMKDVFDDLAEVHHVAGVSDTGGAAPSARATTPNADAPDRAYRVTVTGGKDPAPR